MASIIDSFGKYYAKDRAAWRKWLEKNHKKSPGIWLIYYKKDSGKTRVPYADAVEEALCYGWIDSTQRPGDSEFYMQLFMPRKPKSGWSKLNKERVVQLIEQKLMTAAGIEKIETAKENGTWNKLDDIEAHVMPLEMNKAFTANKKAKQYFDGLGQSTRKYMIYWVSTAKLPATRTKRIDEIIKAGNEGKNPPHFIRKPKE